ncbi:methyl-accepting chemotaxis protein [Acetohalobium arabaticum]|uniref:Methyl-accepting chemotaxis sensory transducer with Cache sensor n=1 Tax=Acetohalobium arabaticum (strain ATCC 49924 / DSM 5501 / Z-7288) TaxID=574087 RepID=D9QPM2_ACEAZ|nr:methyl-accepting chemotaxis protein [Acetohalobium arabaticum]ADL12463.1 methyl-accepting chemotaxis sensory transducer with Cache sensor [Acetohalobium arabaticum DSM 5501]
MKKIYDFFDDQTIQSKLIVLMLLIGLVPIITLGYFEVQETKATIKESFINSTTKEIKQVDNAINLYFETIKENCKMFAADSSVKKADKTITTYTDKVTSEELNLTPLENGGLEAEIYKEYLNFAKSHSNTAYVYMGTEYGSYIQWPATSLRKNYDPRERPFYEIAMKNKGEVVRTSPYASADGTGAIISTVTTIKDETGEVIGVQGLDVSLESLADLVKNMKIGKTGYVIMTTSDGTILAHPKKPELNFKNVRELGVDKLNNLSNIEQDNFKAVMNNKDYLMNVYTSSKTGWKFIAVVEESELAEALSGIYKQIIWITALAALVIIATAILFSKRFSQPIVDATNFAQEIARGNLNVESLQNKSNNEIGNLVQALDKMRDNLRNMIADLMDAIEDLSAYSQELSASAEEGNAVIETNNQNLNEMATSIQQISASSQEVTGLAQEANSQTQAGSKQIDKITSIKGINQVVSNAVENINELNANSEEIEKIVDIITNIAEQTNLLALNAAIEAARAGEDGRGFAVVAEEIRELAEETAEATKEIDGLIQDTQNKSEAGLEAVKEMKDKIEDRKETLQKTSEVFSQIEAAIEDTSTHIQQTAVSTQNLAENSEQVMDASQDMKNMSQEVTNSSQELANMAQKLQGLIEEFKV